MVVTERRLLEFSPQKTGTSKLDFVGKKPEELNELNQIAVTLKKALKVKSVRLDAINWRSDSDENNLPDSIEIVFKGGQIKLDIGPDYMGGMKWVLHEKAKGLSWRERLRSSLETLTITRDGLSLAGIRNDGKRVNYHISPRGRASETTPSF